MYRSLNFHSMNTWPPWIAEDYFETLVKIVYKLIGQFPPRLSLGFDLVACVITNFSLFKKSGMVFGFEDLLQYACIRYQQSQTVSIGYCSCGFFGAKQGIENSL